MKKPNKQKCVELIVEQIDNGLTYTECLDYFGQMWSDLPKSTFSNYWNDAQEIHSERQQTINDAKLKETIKAEKEAVKRQIMGKHEILENLTKLAKGEAWKVGNEIIAPSASERINAMKTINQMQGYNAPKESKLEIEQNDPFIIELTDESEAD